MTPPKTADGSVGLRDGSALGEKPPTIGDPRVVRDLEAYCAALEQGERPNRGQLLARYPELADELAACLNGLETVNQLVPQLHAHAGGVVPGAPDSADGRGLGALGDFRILREIGRGGMGVVYEAEQISLGRRVALKVLPFAAVLDPKHLQRFKNEATAAAGLHHQNIVPVYSVGCERGVHYYAMQYVDGATLAEVIRQLAGARGQGPGIRKSGERVTGRQGDKVTTPTATHSPAHPLTPSPPHAAETSPLALLSTEGKTDSPEFFRSIAELGVQVAEALDYAHEEGIVHRDVKPSNLILDERGKVWVTDFGLARVEADPGMTLTGDILGTLRYMSPEQALAKRVVVDHLVFTYPVSGSCRCWVGVGLFTK